MVEADVILRFEVAEGQTPDAEKIAHALLAWIDLMKVAGDVVMPGSRVEVGLAGVEDGSDIFKLTLRHCEDFAEHLTSGMKEFPLVARATMALGGMIGSTVIGAVIADAIIPDPRIPADQMATFERNTKLLEESVELQKQQMRFYGILHEEPAVSIFEVIRPYDSRVIYRIPRHEFADRSGLWSGDNDVIVQSTTATRTATWDVVLIKPVLVPEPRRWLFARDGIEFSALMNDKEFLQAIHDKTLPVRMAEGIRMKLEVKYREQLDGQAWVPVLYSHRVSRVLDPLPPPGSIPLFPDTGAP